jgi:hypothetical protein
MGEEEGEGKVQQEVGVAEHNLYTNSLKCYLMKIFSMAVRMRGARRRVKGRYSRNGERWEASVFI